MQRDSGNASWPRDHRVALYHRRAHLARDTARFLAPALAAGDMAVTVLTTEHQDAVDRELARTGVDVSTARARGDYLVVDVEEALTALVADGTVETEAFEATISPLLATVATRRQRLRICGELSPRLWRAGNVVGALAIEELFHTLEARIEIRTMCPYPARMLETAETDDFLALCRRHTSFVPDEAHADSDEVSDSAHAVGLLQRRSWSYAREQQRLLAHAGELEARLLEQLEVSERLKRDFHDALASRDTIGQAKGILMVRRAVDAEAAFGLLRDASNRRNLKLRDVAQAVIDQAPTTHLDQAPTTHLDQAPTTHREGPVR